MRASRALRPAMLRGIVQAIVMLFLFRLFFWFLRLISSGARTPEPEREQAGTSRPTTRRRPLRVEQSNVTDVPFTEIPAGTGAAVPPDKTEPAERAEAR